MRLRDADDYDPTWATKPRVRQPVPQSTDVAIVGAGLGGLLAGAYLAQAGVKVALFDQHYVAGGCCTQFSRGGPRNRFNFDIGLHYIGDCGPTGKIPRLLAGLGVQLDYVPMDADGFDTLVFPGFRFPIPSSHERFRERLVEMFPGEKRGIDRYVRFLREVDDFASRMEAAGGRMGFGMGVWALTQGRLAAKYKGATLKALLDTCTGNPDVRAVMAGQNGDYGLPPSKVSAALHAGLSNHYFRGAWYPRGGGQVIADRVAEVIEQAGGTIHLRQKVERILVEDDRAVGLALRSHKGQENTVRARLVLSNADIRATFDQLLEKSVQPPEWRDKVDGFEMAAAIFMTCLGIRGDMRKRGMATSNYWQFDTTDFEHIYDNLHDLQPRASYITSATLKDPETRHHAPEGISSVEAMTILSGRAEDWGMQPESVAHWDYKSDGRYQEIKTRIEENLVQRVETLFPGSAAAIEFRESATPMSHTRYTLATDGTGYGLAATPGQFFEHRPAYKSPVAGLYLAGASTRSGHGVVGAMESGHKAARRIARELGLELPGLPQSA